ncbi:MAG: type II toxin-antitoxin system mRNA interferase toxin, RelE/StbE family [bacterium]|nr:type II toxin-antitoxin system mRNA interferase toxin, RelE/StbE family [bacterium]
MRILRIYYTTHFNRAYKKFPNDLKPQVREREQWFRADCFDSRLETHKLGGKLKGFWAFSITKKYRILFAFEGNAETTFLDIDDHDLYR